MTSTAPQATTLWGPAEPFLLLCPQVCTRGHHGSSWAAHRGSSQPQPDQASTPACQQPLQTTPSFLLSTSLACSLFLCGQVKNGPVLGPLARKHLFLTREGSIPPATSIWGISKLALGSQSSGKTQHRPHSLWLTPPAQCRRGTGSRLPIGMGSPAFHAGLGPGNGHQSL